MMLRVPETPICPDFSTVGWQYRYGKGSGTVPNLQLVLCNVSFLSPPHDEPPSRDPRLLEQRSYTGFAS